MPNYHTPIEIFIAYARKDDGFLQDLLSHLSPLKRTGNVKTWHDGVMDAGTTWKKDIKDAIHRADIILLLVSAHSLNSDYFYETELTQALERHQKDKVQLIPIIVSPCFWKTDPIIGQLHALPKDGLSIVEWTIPASAYTNIVEELSLVVDKIKTKREQEHQTAIKLADLKQKALDHFEQNDPAQTLHYLLLALDISPTDKDLLQLQNQANALKQKHDTQKRQKETQQQLQNLTAAAQQHLKQQQFEQALTCLQTALQLSPNNAQLLQLQTQAQQQLELQTAENKRLESERKAKEKADQETRERKAKFFKTAIVAVLLFLGWMGYNYVFNHDSPPTKEDNRVVQPNPSATDTTKPPPPTPSQYTQSINEGNDLFVQKKYAEAKKKYETALQHKPNDKAATDGIKKCDEQQQYTQSINEGNDLFVQKKYAEAKKKYEAALRHKPNDKAATDGIKKCDEQPKPKPSAETPKPSAADPFATQMVSIPGNTFWMGSPDSEEDRGNDEYRHQVSVSSFKMSKYEVTQAQWKAIMGSNPSNFKGDNLPVETVSWDDVQVFLKKLNAQTGKTYTLPTEAQWEYAARGGTTTPFYTGNCLSTDQANYDGNYPYQSCAKGQYREKTTTVGSFAPNKYGLYDMHGNVWEWCQDRYDADYYKNSPTNNPKGQSTGSSRVLRGGSWRNFARLCRAAYRDDGTPGNRYSISGFRLVCVP